MFGVTAPEQAAMVMLKGFELGLGLAASFDFIAVINNKPGLIPRGALALVMNSGQLEAMKITEPPEGPANQCTVWMKRKNGFEYQLTWTMADAQQAGLIKPDGGWTKYPSNMLRWRTLGYVIDVLFSDVTGGMKRVDELGADIDPTGNIVNGQWRETSAAPQAEQAPWEAPSFEQPTTEQPKEPIVTLDQLVQEFGAEAVMVAAEGRIPATDEEVASVWGKLKLAGVGA